ncbi:MAG: amino acid ABC transporter permease [Firmicutes bacterium]|nr:amino acid ABC transporter permease [Bacillota bacterium]
MEYAISIMPQIWVGVVNSLKMYFLAILPVLPLGVFFAILKVMGPKPIRWLLNVYTWAWRGTPLLLQLFIAKFGFPYIGINIPLFWSVVGVFTLNMAAYITEIMRAAIQSVDAGQYEACKALGIPYHKMMFRIILPQSFRIALPPMCSEAINLIKDTALICVIGMQDMVRVAGQIVTRDYSLVAYLIVFIIYLGLTSLMVFAFGRLEKRVTAYDR